ncbi:HEAT repeat domain-containing protein [Streptomyces sp. NPDC052236]|uniref:HEAT repeat domain-containing protein n=1 Tax=Streptomyces sp. NPDC052236 TaxID=3365686 RepID=UPI0037CD6D3E
MSRGPERSPWFEIFLSGVNAPFGSTRDDLDGYRGIGALSRLTGAERTEAEDILIGKLAGDDGRAATALAEAGCVRAVPALVERAADSRSPTMRVFAARALLRLGDHSGRAAVAALLRTRAGGPSDRSSAVRLLAEFPDPDKNLMLHTALTDPDRIVRNEAITALLTAHGLGGDETRSGEVLRGIGGRMLSSLASVRDEALAELRTVLARWEAGETAEQLGLTWHADRQAEPLKSFIISLDSEEPEWARDYALDGVAELTGRERALVENLVLLRLDLDRRAVRAAARLGVGRAVEPLRELLRSAAPDTEADVLTALRDLTQD